MCLNLYSPEVHVTLTMAKSSNSTILTDVVWKGIMVFQLQLKYKRKSYVKHWIVLASERLGIRKLRFFF